VTKRAMATVARVMTLAPRVVGDGNSNGNGDEAGR
jgi:hypothetical protein